MKQKYEIGSRLWPVQSCGGRSFVQRPFYAVVITMDRHEVLYGYGKDFGHYECNVFASEAEAQAAADARNPAAVPVVTGGTGWRGMVWCRTCGQSRQVDSSECFRTGWPKCCGYTMTLDSPAEAKATKPLGGAVVSEVRA